MSEKDTLLKSLAKADIEDMDFSNDTKTLFSLEAIMAKRSSLSKFVGAIMFLENVKECEFKEGLRAYNVAFNRKNTYSNEKRSLFNPNITIRAVLFNFRQILNWKVELLFRITNAKGRVTLYDPVDTIDKVFQLKLNSSNEYPQD